MWGLRPAGPPMKKAHAEIYCKCWRSGCSRYLIERHDLDRPDMEEKDRDALIAQYVAKD